MLSDRSSLSKVLRISFEFSQKEVVDKHRKIFSEEWVESSKEKYQLKGKLFLSLSSQHF